MKLMSLCSAAVLCAVVSSGAAAAGGETATVDFHGLLVNSGCTFESGSQSKSVDLGVMTVSKINESSSKSEVKTFDLEIGTCKLVESASTASGGDAGSLPVNLVDLKFTDAYYGSSSTSGALTGRQTQANDGTESNVKIVVQYKGSGGEFANVDFSGGSATVKLEDTYVLSTTSDKTLNFQAWMEKGSTDAIAGNVYGQMTVTFEYK